MIEINYNLSLDEVAKIFSAEVAQETDKNAWKKYTEKFSEIKKIEKLYIENSNLFSEFNFEIELKEYPDYTKGIYYRLEYKYYSQYIYLKFFSPKPLDEKQVRMMLLILFIRKSKDMTKYSFVNDLKWVYNDKREEKDEPEEYISIKWNPEKEKELKDFADYIYNNAKTEQINGIPFEYLRFGDYYYGIQDFDEYIYRTYANDSKIKELVRFIKSNDFVYEKDMSLTDIYNQLLDKGYNWAFECEFNDKRFDVCANGRTYGQEEDKEYLKEECEEIEKTIKNIYANYPDKSNFNIDKLCEELREKHNIHRCSSRIGIIMKIKI